MITAKDNIIYGGPVGPCVTKNYKSVAHFALERFKFLGDQKILIDGVTGIQLSGNDLYNCVIQLANSLKNLNVKEGDVVGLSSENRFEFTITVFAVFCLNATVALYNTTYTERELEHVLNLSKPKLIFTSGYVLEKFVNVAKRNSFVEQICVFFNSLSEYSKVAPFKELMNNPIFKTSSEISLEKHTVDKKNFIIDEISGFLNSKLSTRSITLFPKLIDYSNLKTPSEFTFQNVDFNENVALIACSSGTTGLPKGVQLTQKNVLYTIDRQFDLKSLLEESTVLSVIPWFHNFGCLTMILMSVIGGKLVFLPKFEERLFLSTIQKYQVNFIFMVPPLMVFLAKHPLVDQYNLSSLKVLLCGAAPLSKEVEDAVKKRIGIPVVRQGYGLSESTLSLLVQNDEHCKPGSVGVLKPGTYGKVVDTETGKPLGPFQRGELYFKGDCIMKGYIGDTTATASTVDNYGWLHTGDIGYYDNDFEFFIVDRIKELIKYKGFQVPPAEIEALLLTHPKIKDAAVIGIPDDYCGELPMAFIVKHEDVNLTEKEVIDFVAERASPAKRLHGGVKFVNVIPKNPSGKILRRVLRDAIKNESLRSKL